MPFRNVGRYACITSLGNIFSFLYYAFNNSPREMHNVSQFVETVVVFLRSGYTSDQLIWSLVRWAVETFDAIFWISEKVPVQIVPSR